MVKLSPAPDRASFARAPAGLYRAGRGWIHFCVNPELYGIVFWGRIEREAVVRLIDSLVVELDPRVAVHASLVDARRIESVDPTAFEELGRYVEREWSRLARKVSRLALVRPGGFAGAIATGFYSVLQPPYPVRTFDDREQATAWLGCEADLLGELDRAQHDEAGVEPIVARLRRHLRHADREVKLETVAKEIGTSVRTLQRQLREAGTSFKDQLAHERVRRAQLLMLDTDASLTHIALDVGFASLQAFSSCFRRVVGHAPSAWRSEQRRR